jgi:hypothetical protein
MTLTELLRTLLRRWPIVAVGLVLTLAAAYFSTRTPAVYHGHAEVVFLAPTSVRNPNELVTTSESLIITAGIVMKQLNGPDPDLQYNSQAVNPIGAPDGRTTWIRLLDAGNQWVSNFDDQVLVIDSVGASADQAQQRVLDATAGIREELARMQNDAGSAQINDITTRLSPETPAVTQITGSKLRAAGMTLALGALLTVGSVVVLEVRSRRNAERSASDRRS